MRVRLLVLGVAVFLHSPQSRGQSCFAPQHDWTSGPYFGDSGTLLADVTGDGKADAIAVNNKGIVVRRSTGTAFAPNETWTTGAYYGDKGTFFADVTGDGKADAIAINNKGIVVRRSTGTAFASNETWTTGAYYGDKGTFFADVTGDGKADAIAVNNKGIVVRRSTGTAFAPNETWTTGALLPGTRERSSARRDCRWQGRRYCSEQRWHRCPTLDRDCLCA